MVPIHVLLTPSTTPRACPQLRHSTQKRLAGFGVDLSGVNRIRIEECELVGAEIVPEGKCQIPPHAPVDLKPRANLHIILEIGCYVGVAQVRITRTPPGPDSSVSKQEACETIPSIRAGCGLGGVGRYVRGENYQPRGSRLSPGSASLEVILVRLSDVHTDIHGVPTL